jgi:peptidoglycan/xylan/chitin deacetylase (PgdA/CDA1 family)
MFLFTACADQNTNVAHPGARTIALSFDDATLPGGPFMSGPQRTRQLVAALDKAGVAEAMFFVTTGNMAREGDDGAARIAAYAEAGHALGNHSHSHNHLSQMAASDYIADVDRAIGVLDGFENVLPYYRYPYLDEGRDPGRRDALRAALAERGLHNGYVTVDTWDWMLVGLADEAQQAGTEIDLDDLRDLYVDVIVRSTEFYDAMAQRTLARSPHHVLLLHENDLAALFVGDLVAELERHGFSIIPASEAFRDPIADAEPDTLYLGQGRIAALAHVAGEPAATLRSPTENEAYLRSRFEAEVAALPD